MEKTIKSKRGLRTAILKSSVRHDILKYLDAGVATIDDIIEISVKAGYKTCLPDSVEECLSHEWLDAQETFDVLKARGLWEIIFHLKYNGIFTNISLTSQEQEKYDEWKDEYCRSTETYWEKQERLRFLAEH